MGDWSPAATAQPLLEAGLHSFIFIRTLFLRLAKCSRARISTGLLRLRPELPMRVARSTLSGTRSRHLANQLRRRLLMPVLRRSCGVAQLGGPRLCGDNTRSSCIGCPQLGQLSARVLPSLATGAGIASRAIS